MLDRLLPDEDEDLGNTIQRPQPLRAEIITTPFLPIPKTGTVSQAADTPSTLSKEDLIVLDLDVPVIRIIPTAPPAPRKESTLIPTPMPSATKPKKEKPKVKRDVIDDIFR